MNTINLPDLNRILFSIGDESAEHAGDSCCLSMRKEQPAERWTQFTDEYLAVVDLLAAHEEGKPCADGAETRSGWRFARPLVFAAHHACELVLKESIVRFSDAKTIPDLKHELDKLLDLERTTSGLVSTQADWEDGLVRLLRNAWEAGRYPVNKNGGPLFDQWCCVSAGELKRAVEAFVELVRYGPWVELGK